MIDLAIRGGTIVMTTARHQADVGVDGGRIVDVGDGIEPARETVDATGLLLLPGLVDIHVHFNEPGRTHWEGAATGSAALAAGGGTMFVDMPLNSTPCTVRPADFDLKRAALEASSIADFALWGGLVPGAIGEMQAMAERGVVGFKAFMCDSGLPEFPRADDQTLLDGMIEAARLGLPVAVHAENEELTRARSLPAPVDAVTWARSRPVLAEVEAVQRALLLAEEVGAQLHLVHMSSGQAVAVAAEARNRGVDVSVETCPHYLYFTERDLERLGTLAKCAPPLRSHDVQADLWRQVLAGNVHIVASDHSPTEPALKETAFANAWGGIAGVQSTLQVLLDRGPGDRALSIEHVVAMTATNPARRLGLPRKGAIEVGADADLTLLDVAARTTLTDGVLEQRHRLSPYVGRTFRGVVRRTIRRGETIWLDGQLTARQKGQLVVPGH